MKDLNLEDYIKPLIKAGISSFKIEGRLKDIDFVTNAVAYFRLKIDKAIRQLNSKEALYKKQSSGEAIHNFIPDLSRTFSRGTTKYFIDTVKLKKNKMTTFDTQKSIGKEIGKVVDASGRSLLIESDLIINNGDGLCYYDKSSILQGFKVNNTSPFKGTKLKGKTSSKFLDDTNSNIYKIIANKELSISKGTILFRNEDIEFDKIMKNKPCERVIKANITLEQENENIIFAIIDENNNKCEIITQNDGKSERAPLSRETIDKQLRKSGNTIFEIEKLFIPNDIKLTCSIAELNQIRRDLLDALLSERIKNYPQIKQVNPAIEYKGNLQENELVNISNSLSKSLYNQIFTNVNLENNQAPEVTKNYKDIPLMTTKYCIKRELDICPKENKKGNKAPYLFLKDNQKKYKVQFDCANCMMRIYKA